MGVLTFFHLVDTPAFHTPIIGWLAVHLTALILFFLVYFSYLKYTNSLVEHARKLEKNKLFISTAATLSHEINNPLTIVNFKIKKINVQDNDIETMKLVNENIKKVADIVKKMNEIRNSDEFEMKDLEKMS